MGKHAQNLDFQKSKNRPVGLGGRIFLKLMQDKQV
jgi:hypothetical protein